MAKLVVLTDYMGDDLAIVNNARESLNNKTDWETWCSLDDAVLDMQNEPQEFWKKHLNHPTKKRLSKKDEGLLRSLYRNRHATPFERVVFCFHVTTHIGVSRELFRHRIASYNERSTRYTKLTPETYNPYYPPVEDIRVQVGRAMDYTFEVADPLVAQKVLGLLELAYGTSWSVYNDIMELGVAKEVARLALPLATETGFYWTINLRSLFNFLHLRNAPQALKEIRDIAMEVEAIVAEKCPIAYDAFVQGGRMPI